ncbi:MAG: hypothetical protein A3J79_09300 [Elusimicrobia bacterium RIFOXYB2_FULL_62_6]|nr:MAG: hypothetical protein A3J79_09300 [Elusimicrobia bacterium RIFOXYB2_FULL_62_6]
MQITTEILAGTRLGRAAVISPAGEVDMHESPRLRAALLDAIALRPAAVVVDLAGVTFIDSSGVATLVEAMKLAKAEGLSLVLAGMSDKVRDVFALARLDKFFTLAASRGEALGD